MDLFQEFFVTAMAALIFSCIIVKMVSAVFLNDEKIIVKEEAKISKGLVVKSRKSKKRVKFVEQEVVKNVDHLKIQELNKDGVVDLMSYKVGGLVVDQICEKGVCENLKVENFLKKGDDFEGDEKLDEGKVEVKKIDELLDVKKKDLVNDLLVDGEVNNNNRRSVISQMESGKGGCTQTLPLPCETDRLFPIDPLDGEVKLGENEKILGQSLVDNEVNNNIHSVIPQVESSEGGCMQTLPLPCETDRLFPIDPLDGEVKLGENEKMEMDEYSDDDWEGIERSELEEEFAKAINFVDEGKEKDGCLENLGNELMMQLYALQKIVMEGPCHEPQPMALKLAARAKWNAWQRMGSMNPEVAMEQYIKLLSEHAPGWTDHIKDDHEVESSETTMPGNQDSFNNICKDERTQEMNRAAEAADSAVGEKEKE